MNPNPSVSKVLFEVFGRELLGAGAIKIANDLCNFIQPLLLQEIILFMQLYRTGDVKMWYGLWLAIGLMVSYLIQSISFNQYFNAVNIVSARVRSALMWTVFDKCCKLSSEGRSEFSSGAVQNMMSNDARRLSDLMQYINYLWSGVFQIIVSFTLLVRLLGPLPSMLGIILCLVNTPFHGQLMSAIRSARERALKSTDDRVKILSEIFLGIKAVKLYAWEDSFIARVVEVRQNELKWLRRALLYSAFSQTLVSSLPVILATVSIGAYALLGDGLRPEIVFPALALLNVLRAPLLFLPNVLLSIAQAKASINRIEAFLAADELSPINGGVLASLQSDFDAGVDVVAKNAAFSWDKTISNFQGVGPTISGINMEVRTFSTGRFAKAKRKLSAEHVKGRILTLTGYLLWNVNQVKKGELWSIVGPTGSGKSSLLAGLLREAFLVGGTCAIRPGAKVAFVDQTAFIFNATLRDNILFGSVYDEEKYQETIRVTALVHDLHLLPAGDMTEIGGRGVNLSGGQRQRVSLARAVYSDADIYLFDDPLSAVDAAVGKHIFNSCILGALEGKTRIFVTNQIQLLNSPQVTDIMLLSNGVVQEQGTYAELMAEDGVLGSLIKTHFSEKDEVSSPGAEDFGAENDKLQTGEKSEAEIRPANAMDGGKPSVSTKDGTLTDAETRQLGTE